MRIAATKERGPEPVDSDFEVVEIDERHLPRPVRLHESEVAPASIQGRSGAAATGANPRPLPGPIAVLAAAITAILAAALAGAALLAWHSSTRIITTTQTVAGPPVPETADAIGCPVTARCSVSPMPLSDSLSAIGRWNPGVAVDVGTVVFDERGTPVHSLVTVEVGTRRTAVTIAAQCVPHGARVANSVRIDANSSVVAVTVGGRPGCSVVVTGALPAAVLSRLAHAPELQL